MRTTTNSSQNPQKLEPLNISGFLDSSKLYKQTHDHSRLPPKSKRNRDRKSPLSTKLNMHTDHEQMFQESIPTGRHTFLSQRHQKKPQRNFQGFYTSRNEQDKQQDRRVRFVLEPEINSEAIRPKVFLPISKKRFYYKEEYDSVQKDDQMLTGPTTQQQSQRVMTGYLTKTYRSNLAQQMNPVYCSRFLPPADRSKSPLEQSHHRLFSKCYRQTYLHVKLMLKQIHQSQQKLRLIHKEVTNTVFETIKQQAAALRDQMVDLVEETVSQWVKDEWKFVRDNEMVFMDDILELQEQLDQRQMQIQNLIQKLQEEKKQSQKDSQHGVIFKKEIGNSRVQSAWRSVAAELLMFNYEQTIIQFQDLIKQISQSSIEKCNKGISILPSTSIFDKGKLYETLSPQSRSWFKSAVFTLMNSNSNLHGQNSNIHSQNKNKQQIDNFSPI